MGEAIFKQASGEGASSEKIEEASEAVFGTAVNVILTVDTSQNDEQVQEGNGKMIATWGIIIGYE